MFPLYLQLNFILKSNLMVYKWMLIATICVLSAGVYSQEQDQLILPDVNEQDVEPFLFSMSTLTADKTPWVLSYSGSYGDNLTRAFGFNGVDQQLGVKGYLGKRFTLIGYLAVGVESVDNSAVSAQRAEVVRDLIGGNRNQKLRLGAGLGMSRDYSNVFSAVSRFTSTFESSNWKIGGNLLLEKALSGDRDAVDVITSLGIQYRLIGNLYAGAEAIGEDLEGIWEEDEAEGGAKLMLGPSVNLVPEKSRFTFSLSGGPVFWLTRSEVTNPAAIRDLPNDNGVIVRARLIFNLAGS